MAHQFKMSRIDAGSVTAQMINLNSRFLRGKLHAVMQLIRHAMRQLLPSVMPELPVAISTRVSEYPARAVVYRTGTIKINGRPAE